jgi:hypothetical protein
VHGNGPNVARVTGLIYAVIVGLWAVVLVPMWLRKHDVTTESRSVDRFSTAMRTLSRRTPPPTRSHDVLMPRRANAPIVSGGRAPSSAARRAEAERLATVRRRRTALVSMAGFFVVVALAALMGAAPLWLPVLVVLAFAGYVRFLRVEAQRAQQLARRERRRAASAAPARPVARRALRDDDEVFAEPVVARRAAGARGEAWEPTPVVLPTYATAPPATSVPRTIDLTHQGAWSAASMLEHAANRPDPDEIFDARAEAAAPAASDAEFFDQTAAEHDAVAAEHYLDDSPYAPLIARDAVFDQEDEELLGFLDRRASGS